MKYIKLFENFNDSDIHEICLKYGITNYTINEDGSIDVNGDVNLNRKGLTKLPLKFRNVTGNFNCSYNELTSLEGSPKSVGGKFNCNDNLLTSLEGSPKSVGGNFRCYNNLLTSLEGSPKYIGGNFNCNDNDIIDFIGFVEPVGYFSCDNNTIHNIWSLFEDKEHIELLNEYDCIRGNDIVIDRLNMFLEEIDKPTVKSVYGYNNI